MNSPLKFSLKNSPSWCAKFQVVLKQIISPFHSKFVTAVPQWDNVGPRLSVIRYISTLTLIQIRQTRINLTRAQHFNSSSGKYSPGWVKKKGAPTLLAFHDKNSDGQFMTEKKSTRGRKTEKEHISDTFYDSWTIPAEGMFYGRVGWNFDIFSFAISTWIPSRVFQWGSRSIKQTSSATL